MDDDSDPPFNFEPSLAPQPPPPPFMCPISHEVARDPVSCADGHSYERAHIERWLVSNSTSLLTCIYGHIRHGTAAISLAAAVNDANDAAGTTQLYDSAEAVDDANDTAAQLHDAAGE